MFATVRVRLIRFAAAGVFAGLWLGHASGAAQPSTTLPDVRGETAAVQLTATDDDGTPHVSAAAAASGTAGQLLAVRSEASGEGTVVHLDADGTLEGVKSFTLSEPARLVVDLPGVESKVAENLVPGAGGAVERIRIGQHEGKVRVVIDAGANAAAFEGRELTPVASGLVIALGGAQATAAAPAAEPSAEADVSMTAGAQGGSLVQKVSFTSGADGDRLVVSADRAVDYQIMRPDPKTLMLVVPGAQLAPDAGTRVAPEGGGPVSLVSAFEQPDLARPEVRVVIERAAGLEPKVSKDGNDIVLVFERGQGVAAALPVGGGQAETPASPAPPAPAKAAARRWRRRRLRSLPPRRRRRLSPTSPATRRSACWRRAACSTASSTSAAASPWTSRTSTSTTCSG